MTNTLRKILLLFILTISLVGVTNSQSLNAYINAAENAYAKHDYFTALVYFKKVLEVEPQRNDIHFKYAEAAREFQAYRIAGTAMWWRGRNITFKNSIFAENVRSVIFTNNGTIQDSLIVGLTESFKDKYWQDMKKAKAKQ